MDEIRSLAPTGACGSGFLESLFEKGLSQAPHFIGCDAGSADLGISGQLDHPDILRQIERAAAAARKHGKFCGAGSLSGNDTGPLCKVPALGPRHITGTNEWSLMMGALQERSKWFRELPPD